ncbi:MAG: electron transfer flavoprotein-ubiquinone oxidoreductase [Deltaproteobacteria bacterium]|nr:electron transfer flavoprotein-ubiquinone oxidoreductase [Deltaproteobacteria bacterium]
MTSAREHIEFDVLFVGAGPANLAGAIHLMQLAQKKGLDLDVALIEKGADIGSHALSGAVMNPIALKELMPDYLSAGCPVEATVRGDAFYILTQRSQHRLPIVPRVMKNEGFHVISLSKLVHWLAGIAEEMGVNIFPGFSGAEVLYAEDATTVTGVRTGDKGRDKDGQPKSNFEPGIDILAKVTVLGEGAKGSLVREMNKRLGLFDGRLPQTFETGIKEVIQLPKDNFFSNSPFNDVHTLGYPLGVSTHGGGFIYQMAENRISLGLVVSLGYTDPMMDLYEQFIRFKRHPLVMEMIEGGQVIEQGARTLENGGYYTIPKLAVDGALVVGSAASMQNGPALKGIHTAMKSGMLAAETMIQAFSLGRFTRDALDLYETLFENSWIKQEIYAGRNFAQAVSKKMPAKAIHLALQVLTGGRGLIDKMSIKEDSKTLSPLRAGMDSDSGRPDERQNYDGKLFVDKLTGVYLSKTQHREDQPCHLVVHDPDLCVDRCYSTYGAPCTRFCPGGVYEMDLDEKTRKRRLKVNFSNCLHCKTCEIKDPYENITWTCPEGGDGPGYTVM